MSSGVWDLVESGANAFSNVSRREDGVQAVSGLQVGSLRHGSVTERQIVRENRNRSRENAFSRSLAEKGSR